MPGEHTERGRNCGICTVSLFCVLVALVIFKDWAATPAGTFDCTADPDDNTDCANNATAGTGCSDGGPSGNEGQCDGKGHCICPDPIFAGFDAFCRMVMVLLGVCAGCIIAVIAIACGYADVCLEDLCFRQRSSELANLLPVTASITIPNGDRQAQSMSTGGSAIKYGAVAEVRRV